MSTAVQPAHLHVFQWSSRGWSRADFPKCDSANTLVLAFGPSTIGADSAALTELRAAFPSSCFLGCSTAGEILGAGLQDDSLVIAVFRFEKTSLRSASAPVRSAADSRRAGETLGSQLNGPDLRGVLVLSDGLSVNGSELVVGMISTLPQGIIITGGLAGDGSRFKSTWTLRNGIPTPGWVTAVGFYGSAIRIGHGSKGGWDVFGPERTVTRSVGNTLFELDGRPALPLYKEYLGDRAEGLPATALLFPLALRRGTDGESIVRTVLAVDERAESMTFAGDIPQGARAQLMRANFDRLIEGASESALSAHIPGAAGPVLAIAVSCVGRRLVLGSRAEEELERTLEVLPAGSKQVGFYSYGEISPLAGGTCDLHNQTMTITTICES